MSVGANSSKSKSSQKSKTKQPAFALNLGAGLARGFGGLPFRGALAQPLGIQGSLFQNLFDPNASPAQDFLGARSTLEGLLSDPGQALGGALGQAQQALLPAAERSIDLLNQRVLSANAPLGLRFSSDVMDQQRQGAQDILLGTQQQALGAALPIFQGQLGGALNIFDLIANLAEGQLGRQIPLAVALSTGTPPVTRSSGGSRGRSFGFDFTKSG